MKKELQRIIFSTGSKTIACFVILLASILPFKSYATGADQYPSIIYGYGVSSVTGGSSIYCQNATAYALTVSWGNSQCGSGSYVYIPITVSWYYNTTQTNTGGTLVNTVNTNSSVTSSTYTPSTATAGTFYYYVVISWGAGPNCASAGSITSGVAYGQYCGVTVYANPVPSVTASINPICNGDTTILTAGETAGNSNQLTYTWQATSNPPPTYGPNSITSYTVAEKETANNTYTLTVTDGNGCKGITTATVSVNPNPVPSLSASPVAICYGNSSKLTVGESGGTHPYNYTWAATANPPSNLSTNLTSYTVSVSPTATDTYTLTVTDNNNCSGTIVKTVTVNTLPIVYVTGTSTICNGSNTVLTATGADTYSWTGGPSTASYTVSPTGTTTYTVTGTNTVTTCSNTASQVVTVNSLPSVGITGTSTICKGSNTTLTGTGANTYSWTGGPSTASYNVSPASTATYTVTGTNTVTTCSNTATQVVTVNALPVVSISGLTTICRGSNTTLTGNGADTYVWTGGPGTAAYKVSPISSTTYTVTGTSTVTTCSDTATAVVKVNALPTVSINGASSLCIGAVTLTASPTGVGPFMYSWSNGGTNDTIEVLKANTYTVSVSDVNNCVGTNTFKLKNDSVPAVHICTVTVDTGSTHNIIVWDKTGLSHVDSFKVYYMNSSSVWQLIKAQPFSAPNYVVDSTPINNPNANTVRYCLTAVDSCGNEEHFSSSPWQNTTFIIANGSGTFSWGGTGYLIQNDTNAVKTYILYRDSVCNGNWKPIDSVSGSQNQMTDVNYSKYPLARYRVDARFWVGACPLINLRPTYSVSTTTSRSNTEHNGIISGIKAISNNEAISIYPNPANSTLNIKFNFKPTGINIKAIDITGRIIMEKENESMPGNLVSLDISTLPAGLYFIKVTTNSASFMEKFIKE